ncbi:MAG: VOC family protein [Acidimicrobiia bacterium]
MPGAVAALFARIGPGFFQQAFVVDDLDAAMAAFTERAGCEHWTTFPAIGTPYHYRGRDIESSVGLAFSRSGRVQIELLHPIDGEGLTHDFLAEYGPGAHHLGFLVQDAEAEVAAAEADGIEAVMSGHIGTLHYVYLDTFADLGVYLEVIEDPDGLIAQLTP